MGYRNLFIGYGGVVVQPVHLMILFWTQVTPFPGVNCAETI